MLAGIGPAHAQNARSNKMAAWVNHVLATSRNVAPMSNGTVLGFPSDQVQRKQVGVTNHGVLRLFAVVTPLERDGIILAAGHAESRTFTVHRTGTHLRRIASGRNQGGNVSAWHGSGADSDFRAQVDFWVSHPIK